MARGKTAVHDQDKAFTQLIAPYAADVQKLCTALRNLVRKLVPDAVEEIDTSAKMLGFSFIPGTYKGSIVGIAPQKSYVNLMFAKGAELQEVDPKGLLEGTGKLARHIKFRTLEQIKDPAARALIEEAARRTPRSR
jgi:hypothetical protein